MGDVDDPYLYAAQPLHEFMQTEKGLWIKEHAHDPTFLIQSDVDNYGHVVRVYGYLRPDAETYFRLRWA